MPCRKLAAMDHSDQTREHAPPVDPHTPDKLPIRLQRAEGAGRLSVKQVDGHTRLEGLHQSGCARILLPRTHRPHLEAVLINTAGGLTGGDRLSWDLTAGEGTRLVATTQACERIYRSLNANAQISTRLSVGPEAHLMWFPQETILYDNARLERRLRVDLAATARFTAIEIVLLGRQAMKESARDAHMRDDWRIARAGELVHAEATRLSGKSFERAAAASLDGQAAFATLVHLGPDATLIAEQFLHQMGSADGMGVSASKERLVLRALAPSGLAMRRRLTPLLKILSPASELPRVWSI